MVQSRLDPSINFSEVRFLDKVDIDFKAPVYSLVLYKKPIIIALGQLNTNFQERANIVYFPIYLINHKKVILQIGVYEILSNNLSDVLDKEGDLDLTLVGLPLIYSFIKSNLNLLINNNLKYDKLSKIEEEDETIIKETKKLDKKQSKEEREHEEDREEDREEGREEDEGREEEGSEEEGSEEEGSEEEGSEEGEEESQQEDEEEGESEAEEQSEEDSENEGEDEKGLDEEQYESALQKKLNITSDKEKFKQEQKEFLLTKDTKWIEKYFKNNNFDRINNEGDGECLFAVIRDGLQTISEEVTVKELRNRLAKEATEEIFQNYKEKYDMFKSGLEITNTELQLLVKRNKELKIQLTATTDRSEHKKIIAEASDIKINFEELKKQLNFQKDLLDEWKFMKNIKTLDQFKELINSCYFWADTWAISTLERIYNIKLIIFSFEQYNEELLKTKKTPTTNTLNIVLCGQLNDKILEERGKFEPSYYIMADYDGSHYQLITYKKRGAFTFEQLPYQVKKLVSENCLQGDSGTFLIIPDIKNFKISNIDEEIQQIEGGGLNFGNDPTNSLYNDNIHFKFYSKSLDCLPGRGSGEKISDKDINEFHKLAGIKDWRKKLSNFWEGEELNIDGKKWKTVEHYINAIKFKNGYPSFYNQFSLDANTTLSKNPLMARAAGSKNGRFKNRQIRPTHITIDENYTTVLPEALNRALYVKFIQNKEMKNLLKSTGKAKLLHYKRGSKPIICSELMKIRKLIK